jgi:4-aminobutyrate aminotransferase / (S)-3-amino-2-methylpropionate transaminase
MARAAIFRSLRTPINPRFSRLRPATATALRPLVFRRAMASAASETPFFPGEPSRPVVKTAIPGPKAKEAIARLDKVFETRSLNMMGDYSKSIGN